MYREKLRHMRMESDGREQEVIDAMSQIDIFDEINGDTMAQFHNAVAV